MQENFDDVQREAERAALAERLVAEGSVRAEALRRIAVLATRLFGVEAAAVAILGTDRLWFETAVGVQIEVRRREETFGAQVVAANSVLIVPDALADARFRDLALVREHGVRFYAGTPLRSTEGLSIGAFCVFDTETRMFCAHDQRLLEDFAAIAMTEIEGRRARRLNGILHGMAQTVGAALVCTDERGAIVYMNPAAERLLGYEPAELIGRDVVSIMPERFAVAHRTGMARVAGGAASKLSGKVIETVVTRKDGREVPIDLSLSVWRDEAGLNFASTMRDITERKQEKERLSRLAYYDPLTGLARAARFHRRLAEQLEAVGTATVLVLEIDGVRAVDDDLGQAIGDALVQAIAIRLVAAVPHGTKLARWSGRIFAAMLPQGDPFAARECANDIEMALAEPFEIDSHRIVVGASIGAAIAPDHARTDEDLVAAADLAMHRAKSDHGNRFRLFDRSLQTESAARRALRDEVRRALAADQLILYYQPQVSLATGAVVGAEALMRWRHPTRGLLMPGSFIPAMEDNALALHAGWWSLDQACRQIVRWRAERRPSIRVSVNLFAAQLRFGGLTSIVADLMATHAIAPGELELEVRETIANQDDEAVVAVLRGLRDLGVGIALDDFGTGYASLSTLKRLPVTTIKIDSSFVHGLSAEADPRDSAIAAAILAVGRDLGLDVVAEGIETRAQAAALKRMGCPTGQGHFYGHPADADRLFAPPQTAADQLAAPPRLVRRR